MDTEDYKATTLFLQQGNGKESALALCYNSLNFSLSLCVTVDWAWSAEKMTEEYCHVSQTAAETSYLQQKTCRLSQNASKQASVHHALKNAAPLQLFG